MEPATAPPTAPGAPRAWPQRRFGLGPEFTLPRWARTLALLGILAGLAWRATALVLRTDFHVLWAGCDGGIDWNMASNLLAGKGLYVTQVNPGCSFVPFGPSHHFSPLLPLLEAGSAALLGPTLQSVDLALFLVSAAAVLATVLCTADLFGWDAGLAAGCVAAWDWTLRYYGTTVGHAESLVFLTLVLTLWGILRSLHDERYIVWAGLFAGLGYLSKASAGWFFLLAGLGGLSWRLWHRGWATFRSKPYLAAILVFGSLFGAWALRNLLLFWDHTPHGLLTQWQTSEYNARVTAAALSRPAAFARALALKAVLLAIVPLPILVPLGPEVRAAVRQWRREDVSGILLSAVLLFALGWLFSAAFYLAEGHAWYWLNHVRYVAPVVLPLAWLVVGYGGRPFSPWRWGAAAVWLVAYQPLLDLVPSA